jgi:hypothetical protein
LFQLRQLQVEAIKQGAQRAQFVARLILPHEQPAKSDGQQDEEKRRHRANDPEAFLKFSTKQAIAIRYVLAKTGLSPKDCVMKRSLFLLLICLAFRGSAQDGTQPTLFVAPLEGT